MRCRASRLLRGSLTALLITQAGCSAANRPGWLQEPGWNKPWSYRSAVASAVCAGVGAGAGAGIGVAVRDGSRACGTVIVDGKQVQSCSQDDDAVWIGALIGAASGAVLCALLGHVFLDPADQALAIAPTPPPLPEPTPAPPPVRQRIVLRGVNFDFDSSVVRPESRPVLDQGAELLKQNPDVLVVVEGFTDSIGGPEYNQQLSVRRAEAVYRYLVNQGVDPERLTVEGFGETRPIADNDTESGRAQNRRVELHPQQGDTAP
jgi:OOP family OmpA-OmpF porin